MGFASLLVEIGTEELPPKSLRLLAERLRKEIFSGLVQANLVPSEAEMRAFATPRRLAALCESVATQQPSLEVTRRGPALSAAFDSQGKPTAAATGFARSCGVSVAELSEVSTAKGVWLAHKQMQEGRFATELIPDIVATAITRLPIAKRMRWGVGDAEFVRPVHWIVMLLGETPITASLLGVGAGARSYGHRFHAPDAITLTHPGEYAKRLYDAKVMVDFEQRRKNIENQIEAIAAAEGAHALIDHDLLEEVTAIVEWPVALIGAFDPEFLAVPKEVLISTMQDNQKYFPLVDNKGGLRPQFIAIANIESRKPASVRHGNERVIIPRFKDAKFFWDRDREQRLEQRNAALSKVIFQRQLGSLQDKVTRIERLTAQLALKLGEDQHLVSRASRLCKCDLVTLMVSEFPELQGVMGGYYAQADGEDAAVVAALAQHYQPRFADDAIPDNPIGQLLSLADKLDTVVGIFAIGEKPTGDKDPYALRRMSLGILRIAIEAELDIELPWLIRDLVSQFEWIDDADQLVQDVWIFVQDRLRYYCAEQGVAAKTIEAVLQKQSPSPLDIKRRIDATVAFQQLAQAQSLSAASKRIRNIVRKSKSDVAALNVQTGLFEVDAEHALFNAVLVAEKELSMLIRDTQYFRAYQTLAILAPIIDRYFVEVMVMADDKPLRDNRLACLQRTDQLFCSIADLSKLSA